MKKIALASALSVAATGASAGGMMMEPMMEPSPAPVIVEEAAPASASFVLPLLALAVVAAVVASAND